VQGARREAEFAIAKFQDQAEQHQERRRSALFRSVHTEKPPYWDGTRGIFDGFL
jgi:hypothetical protein